MYSSSVACACLPFGALRLTAPSGGLVAGSGDKADVNGGSGSGDKATAAVADGVCDKAAAAVAAGSSDEADGSGDEAGGSCDKAAAAERCPGVI